MKPLMKPEIILGEIQLNSIVQVTNSRECQAFEVSMHSKYPQFTYGSSDDQWFFTLYADENTLHVDKDNPSPTMISFNRLQDDTWWTHAYCTKYNLYIVFNRCYKSKLIWYDQEWK